MAEFQRLYKPMLYTDVSSSFGGSVNLKAPLDLCWDLWSQPHIIQYFVPGLAQFEVQPDGVHAHGTVNYVHRNDPKKEVQEMRFANRIVDLKEREYIAYEATDGWPHGLKVMFEEMDDGSTTVSMYFYCCLPFYLTLKYGIIVISADVEDVGSGSDNDSPRHVIV